MLINDEELLEFTKIFAEEQDSPFVERPIFLHVMEKLHVHKLEYTLFENSLPGGNKIVFEDSTKSSSKPYFTTRKRFRYGLFELRTFIDDSIEPEEGLKETLQQLCEIIFLGVSRIILIENAMFNLYHDEMTKIYNNNYFMRHCFKLINEGVISNYAALYLNISRCRYLNTIFGNRITDQIIITFAKSLEAKIDSSKGECVSRLGGDFFTLIVLKENLSKFTENLDSYPIECDYELDHISYNLSIKAGIALLNENNTSVDTIMGAISAAQSIARDPKNESNIVYFTPALFAAKFTNQGLTDELLKDFKASKLMVYYQPCIHLDGTNQTITGCEALLRWRRSEEMVNAADIIPIAEQSRLIFDIDLYVIDKVCSKIKYWKSQGYKTVPVSCNLSEFDFKFNSLASDILAIIKKHEIDSSDISFEFGELAYEHEPDLIAGFIREMKKHGIRVGIEDYSNSFLPFKIFTETGFDYIKIDYDKINSSDPRMLTVLDTFISLTKTLGIEVIIKNINNEEVIQKYVDGGCNKFQSEYFEKALSERFFENKLKNQ